MTRTVKRRPAAWQRSMVLAMALVLAAASAHAATITGRVTGPDGRPVAGVSIYLVDAARGIKRGTATDAEGQYTVDRLPAGDFLFRTCQPGKGTVIEELTGLGADETRQHDVALPPLPVYRIENKKVALAIDGNGTVVELCNKQTAPDHNLISSLAPGFWHLVFRRDTSWENVVLAQAQEYTVEEPGDGVLQLRVDSLRYRNQKLPITILFTVRLRDDELTWTARIDNRSDVEVTEFAFPELGGIRSLGKKNQTDYLYWPAGAGERIAGFAARPLRLPHPYPASMSWFAVANGREALYLGAHDDTFMAGELQVGPNADQGGQPTLGFVKFPFVRPGEKWTSAEYVVSPCTGTWHTAADKYRRWMETWRKVRPKPPWVERMTGMFLVILNQQYGDVMWHYDDLPYLYEEAQANGLDTLGLFGWTEGGHDNKYPVYEPGGKMGGRKELLARLKKVADAGGHTILYLQGRLLDAEGPYFKSPEGQRVAARNLWGSPYFEQYNKYSHSDLLRIYSRKLQGIADPIHPEWRQTLVAKGLEAAKLGSSGLIFDQIGGCYAYPAFDAGEVKPSLAFPLGQQKLLAELREGLKRDDPNFGFMVELLTDVYSQYADVLHGCGPGFAPGGDSFPAMSRYVMPDLVVTSRNPMVRIDARRSNFALAYGFRPEVEVRYDDDAYAIRNRLGIDQAHYLRKVCALRNRYWDLLGTGRFTDTLGIENANPAVTVTGFRHGDRLAVVTWNDTAALQKVDVAVPGYRLVEVAGVDGLLKSPPQELGAQRVAVWVFQQNKP